MNDLIFHHHDPSPFAEKIRLVFGIKNLTWSSVQIPMVMPKPDLTLLTGGYRKTPVLQIGADIFCDTQLIAREIDERFPTPKLFSNGLLTGIGIQHWSDAAFFQPGAALSLYENKEHIPAEVSEDRRDYFTFLDFSRFEQDAPHFRAQFRAHAALIDAQLSDGRRFVHGDNPDWSDVCAYFSVWMAGGNIPSAANMFAAFSHLNAWRARMDAIGHGERREISAHDAINQALNASPAAITQEGDEDSGAAPGDEVSVAACDYGTEPVTGRLLAANDRSISILRRDERIGEVGVHFPRIGYRLERNTTSIA